MSVYLPRKAFMILFVSFSAGCTAEFLVDTAASAPAPASALHHNFVTSLPSDIAIYIFFASVFLSRWILAFSGLHQEAVSLWIENKMNERTIVTAVYSSVGLRLLMVFEENACPVMVFTFSFFLNAISFFCIVLAREEDAARVGHVIFAKQWVQLSLLLSSRGWWLWWIYVAGGLSIVTVLGLISTPAPVVNCDVSNAVEAASNELSDDAVLGAVQ